MLIKEDNGNYLGFSAFFLTSETFAPLEISRVVITRSASLPWKAQRRRRRPGRKIAGFGPLGPGSRNPRFRGPKDPKPAFRDLRSRFGVSGVPESGTPVSGGNPEIPEIPECGITDLFVRTPKPRNPANLNSAGRPKVHTSKSSSLADTVMNEN